MFKFIKKTYLALAAIAIVFAACDDDTASIGIFEDNDFITNSTDVFELTTRSLLMDSVKANSSKSYLGSIVDPETGDRITADFAAQFHSFEDYTFPKRSLLVGNITTDANGDTINIERGTIKCDSCEIRLYFDDLYGDKTNPMKLQVYELDPTNILSEDSTYYTDIDLSKYHQAKPIAERVFTPADYNLSDTELGSSTHSDNVHIVLPDSIGQRIMERYYENPSNFKDSYHFIRNVLPGLYFRISNGEGTMLGVYVSTINVYFKYAPTSDSKSIETGLARFAATPEVIQSTRFDNNQVILDSLVQDSTCTYLKTPAGICTEMTLPIDTIFAGEHASDSVSRAEVTLTRYNKAQNTYELGTPSELLMVRKTNMYKFFAENHVADNRTSYTTTFNTTYNTYTFTNICRLISYAKHEKIQAVQQRLADKGITNYTSAQFKAEEQLWMNENPDWDKVVLIPVKTSKATNSSTSTSSQTSVVHDMGMNSIRLVGGNTPIKMQVIYSKFRK